MVVQYIANRPILDLSLDTERRPGSRAPKWWWEQEGLFLQWRQSVGVEDGYIGGYGYKDG